MNIKPRILYLSHANADLYQLIDSVSDNRFEMVFLENDCDTERVEKIEHCQGVICAATKLTNEHLAAGRNLKIIHHQGFSSFIGPFSIRTIFPINLIGQ